MEARVTRPRIYVRLIPPPAPTKPLHPDDIPAAALCISRRDLVSADGSIQSPAVYIRHNNTDMYAFLIIKNNQE